MDREFSVYNPSVMQNISAISETMANCNLIPDSLRCEMKDGKVVNKYPIEQVRANCFLIAEQANRWGLSPFGVAQHASVVRGKLMWEGKLVHSVLQALTGINLNYEYEGQGLEMKVTVTGLIKGEATTRSVTGVVKDWKSGTWGAESNWQQRLAYRGGREWTRRHMPSVMLGVYTDDEELPQRETRNVTPVVHKEASNPFTIEKKQEAEVVIEKSDNGEEEIITNIIDVKMSKGNKKDGSEYTLYKIIAEDATGDLTLATFSKTMANIAKENKGKQVSIKFERTDKINKLVSIVSTSTEEGIAE